MGRASLIRVIVVALVVWLEGVLPGQVGHSPGRRGSPTPKTLEQSGGLEALAGAHESVSAHHGNNYLPLLDQHYRSHRSALFTRVEATELEATTTERGVMEGFLRELRGAKAAFVPEEITVERPGVPSAAGWRMWIASGSPARIQEEMTWSRLSIS